MNVAFYTDTSLCISKLITKRYSTSFSLAVSLLEREVRDSIYAIYGFVRLADEIVDSFHSYDKSYLLNHLREELDYSLEHGISSNPILHSFSKTVNQYRIDKKYINAFLNSMEADITKQEYHTEEDFAEYIYGSADVVGLMCLKVFCNGNELLFNELKYPAAKLGSAFQKVNFLRDLREDIGVLKRSYFPEMATGQLQVEEKRQIENSIEKDFAEAYTGIKKLPGRSKMAVYLAYLYFYALLRKIKNVSVDKLLSERIRIPNFIKYMIIISVFFAYHLKLINRYGRKSNTGR